MTDFIEDGRIPAEPPLSQLLTNAEIETLVLMLGYGQQPEGFTDADIHVIVTWAEEARMNAGLLENILKDDFCCRVVDGALTFGLTPKGEQEAQAMVEALKNGQTKAKENPT